MAIKFFNMITFARAHPRKPYVVLRDGTHFQVSEFLTAGPNVYRNAEFVCDTLEEAEKLRLLIEQRREERGALDRKWELRLAEEVAR